MNTDLYLNRSAAAFLRNLPAGIPELPLTFLSELHEKIGRKIRLEDLPVQQDGDAGYCILCKKKDTPFRWKNGGKTEGQFSVIRIMPYYGNVAEFRIVLSCRNCRGKLEKTNSKGMPTGQKADSLPYAEAAARYKFNRAKEREAAKRQSNGKAAHKLLPKTEEIEELTLDDLIPEEPAPSAPEPEVKPKKAAKKRTTRKPRATAAASV